MRTRFSSLCLEFITNELKIIYQDTIYNDDKISEFQTNLEVKVDSMKQNIEERKPQYIHIYVILLSRCDF